MRGQYACYILSYMRVNVSTDLAVQIFFGADESIFIIIVPLDFSLYVN